jgi:hypothetical protein
MEMMLGNFLGVLCFRLGLVMPTMIVVFMGGNCMPHEDYEEKAVSSIKGLSEEDVEELYQDYAKSFGDSEAPIEVSARHGFWELVGQRAATNSYCGKFLSFKICNRVELHGQANLDGVSHAGDVFVRKMHRSCNNPQCRICVFSGWAKREADHITQRIEVASKRFGKPQHIIVSPPEFDWGLAEFENERFFVKVKKLLFEVGVVGGCLIWHAFRFANYQESLEKNVLYGWRFSPHIHSIAFILGGYGKCRNCSSHRFECLSCDGFEGRVRRSYVKNKYIIKCMDERATIFGTAWYQLNHSAIRVVS